MPARQSDAAMREVQVGETDREQRVGAMKLLVVFLLTIIVADVVFLLTGSFVLAAITGLVGGFSWARSQRVA